MLHLISALLPPPLHRAALRLAHRARKQWWRWRKPLVLGVMVIARNGEGQVLLVRHSYGSGMWTLPGGGVKRREDPARAAAREIAEELACSAEGLAALGVHEGLLHGAPARMHVFTARLAGMPRPDGREIAEARYFPPDALPANTGPRAAEAVGMLSRAGSEQG